MIKGDESQILGGVGTEMETRSTVSGIPAPETVSYSHYMAVAESLERTDRELAIAKRQAAKRLTVLTEAHQHFVAAKFKPRIDDGCVKRSVADYVLLLLNWSKGVENTRDVMRHELENIYMMARMKRAVRHRYPEGKPPEPIGPKSDDADWDHVIRFCEQAGLRPTILRTSASSGDNDDTAEGSLQPDPESVNAAIATGEAGKEGE